MLYPVWLEIFLNPYKNLLSQFLFKNSLISSILDPYELLETKSKSLNAIQHSQFDFEFTK
jgi:hypothetical protein